MKAADEQQNLAEAQVAQSTPLKKPAAGLDLSTQKKIKLSKAAENFNRDFKAVAITAEAPETSKYYWDPTQLFQSQLLRSQSTMIAGLITEDKTLNSLAQNAGQPIGAELNSASGNKLDPTWCKKEYLKLHKQNEQQELTLSMTARKTEEQASLGKRDPFYLSVPKFLAAASNKPDYRRQVCRIVLNRLKYVCEISPTLSYFLVNFPNTDIVYKRRWPPAITGKRYTTHDSET